MDLTTLSGVTAPLTQRLNNEEQQRNADNQPRPQQIPETTASISPQAMQMANAEKSLAQRYDVKNLTSDDFQSLTQELESNGLISELEADELRNLFAENQQTLQSLNTDSEQPRNLLSMLDQESQRAEAQGAPEGGRMGGLFELFNAMDAQQAAS